MVQCYLLKACTQIHFSVNQSYKLFVLDYFYPTSWASAFFTILPSLSPSFNACHFNFVTKRLHLVLTKSPYSLLLLNITVPDFVSPRHPLSSSLHLRGTEVEPKCFTALAVSLYSIEKTASAVHADFVIRVLGDLYFDNELVKKRAKVA